MPMDKVKKLRPKALSMTCGVIFEKSGWNRKCNPAMPPSSITMRTAITTSMRNSRGMRILLSRSMPLFTSNHNTEAVSTMAKMAYSIITGAFASNALKKAVSSRASMQAKVSRAASTM